MLLKQNGEGGANKYTNLKGDLQSWGRENIGLVPFIMHNGLVGEYVCLFAVGLFPTCFYILEIWALSRLKTLYDSWLVCLRDSIQLESQENIDNSRAKNMKAEHLRRKETLARLFKASAVLVFSLHLT